MVFFLRVLEMNALVAKASGWVTVVSSGQLLSEYRAPTVLREFNFATHTHIHVYMYGETASTAATLVVVTGTSLMPHYTPK